MSHGKRMLKAQERRDQMGEPSGDAHGSDATSSGRGSGGVEYLRSNRAFDPDGTPNRPSRRRDSLEKGSDDEPRVELDPASAPAPSVQTGHGAASHAPRQQGTSSQRKPPSRKPSRSRTPPAQLTSATLSPAANRGGAAGAALSGISPQRFLPPGLRTSLTSPQAHTRPASALLSSSNPAPLSAAATATVSKDGSSSAKTSPRRRTTRNYPIERVSAALSSTAAAEGAHADMPPPGVQLTAAHDRPDEGRYAAHTSFRGTSPVSADRTTSADDEEENGALDSRARSPANVTSGAHFHRPPRMPPLPRGAIPHRPGLSLRMDRKGGSAVGARVPMPSPPLRAAVSPRMAPQHLSRMNSSANNSQSRGQLTGSQPASPSASAYVSRPETGGGNGGKEWSLPAAAFVKEQEKDGVLGETDDDDDDTHTEADRQGDRRTTAGGGAVPQPQFPSAPPDFHAHGTSESFPVYVDSSSDFLAEVRGSPSSHFSPPSPKVGRDAHEARDSRMPQAHRNGFSVAPPSVIAASARERTEPSSPSNGSQAATAGDLPSTPDVAPRDAVGSPSSPQAPRPARPIGMPDFSGFRNRGNDCYACSILTLLVRSELFRTALLSCPFAVALRRLQYTRPPAVSSGYTPPPNVYAPCHVGGKMHRQTSLSPTSTDASDEDSDSDCNLVSFTEKGRIVPSLHGQLMELWRQVWLRERFTYRMNDSPNEDEETRRDTCERFLARFVSKKSGENVYRFGVELLPLARLFEEDFFTGEQEDAHEFFVSLVAKLESEAEDFEKRRAEAAEERRAREVEVAKDGPPRKKPKSESVSAPRQDEEDTRALKETSGAKAPLPPAWVNELLQGRLLNIVRCRNPACLHHIASEEPYVNLTVNLGTQPEEKKEEVPAARGGGGKEEDTNATSPRRVDEESENDTQDQGSVPDERGSSAHADEEEELEEGDGSGGVIKQSSPRKGGRAMEGHAAASDSDAPKQIPLISELLFHSLQYSKLEDYVCDACGARTHQYQGACFYATPPPMLVVQLKRFAIHTGLDASGNFAVTMTKDRRELRVEDMLEIFSLPPMSETDAQAYHDKASNQLGERVLQAEKNASLETDIDGEASTGEATESLVDAVRSVYQLRGTVLHLGRLLTFGHYVSQFAVATKASVDESDVEEDTDVAPDRLTEKASDKNSLLGRESRTGHHEPRSLHGQSHPTVDEIRASLPPLQWRLADDAVVRTLDPDTLAEQRAHCERSYMLSYEKVFEERVRVPVHKVLPKLKVTSGDSSEEDEEDEEDEENTGLEVYERAPSSGSASDTEVSTAARPPREESYSW